MDVDTRTTQAKSTAAKRKKREDSDIEEESAPAPAQKKTKTKAAPKVVEPAKPKPRGPIRYRGKKVEINELVYKEPLKVFLFGEGSSGELGFGATKKAIDVKRPRFNEALSDKNVVRIAAGGMHVVALTKDNQILTWGVNDNGALGRDTSHVDVKMRDMDADNSDSDSDDDPTGGLNEAEATPTAVSAEYFPPDTTFVDVAAGDSCTFALTTEGSVFGWGTFRVSFPVIHSTETLIIF
jgi:regulator of chromosome condensation